MRHVLFFSFDSFQPPENLKPEQIVKYTLTKVFNFCFVMLCLALTDANAQNSNEVFAPKTLSPQNQIEQNFKSDEVHTFQVVVVAGQFVEVNADQFGVDIKLTAIAPSGNQISQVNAPTLWFGREELLFIAAETGVYTIKTDAARTGNFAGRYNIVLKNQRLPNAIDLEHLEAVRLFSESQVLIETFQNNSDNLQNAKTKLEAASDKFQKAGNLRGVASSLLLTGRCHFRVGSRRQALLTFQNSLAAWRNIKDSAGEAILLNEIGATFESLGEPDKSFEYLSKALLLRQTNLDRLGEALTLNTICRLYNGTGAMQQGLETCRKALIIRRDGDPTGDVATYNFFGNIYASIGDYKQSAIAFESAIAKFDEAGSSLNRQSRVGATSNLGGVYLELKQCDMALKYSMQALKIVEETGNPPLLKQAVLSNVGESYLCRGDYLKAAETLEQSLAIFEQHNPDESSGLLNVLGNSYTGLNQNEKARSLYDRALMLSRKIADRYALIDTLYNFARLEQKLGKLESAADSIKESISVAERLRASVISKNLRTQFATNRLQKFYDLYVEILMSLDAKNPDKGYAAIALQAHESSRARTLLELVSETGFDLRRDADPKLLQREKDLLETISAQDEKRLRQNADKEKSFMIATEREMLKLSNEYDDLQEEIRRTNPGYAALHEPKILTLAEIQNDFLDEDTALLEYALGAKQSYVWLVKKNSIKSFNLSSREAINLAANQFYSTLNGSSPTSEKKQTIAAQNLGKLILNKSIIEEMGDVKKVLIVTDGSLQYVPFAALLNPNSVKLKSKKTASSAQHDFLLNKAEIITLPSISTLSALQQCGKANQIQRKSLAVMADPVFNLADERVLLNGKISPNKPTEKTAANPKSKDISNEQNKPDELSQALRDFDSIKLPRLPFSGREAAAIIKDAPKDSTLAVGFKANRASILRGDLKDYQFLHFATHGLLNAENPNLSGLVLSLIDENGKPQNGFLRTQDVFTLELHADLVVLSACQTGLGKDIDGEGLVGLTRAFMYAGVPRVVASLWKVDDAATAELMKRFYRAMLVDKKTPSAALRTAQIELSQIPRWKNPTYWAGFVLQGDYR